MQSITDIGAWGAPARLIVVYDSHAAGQRALQMIARVRQLTGRKDMIQASVWNAVMLQFAPLRSIAMQWRTGQRAGAPATMRRHRDKEAREDRFLKSQASVQTHFIESDWISTARLN